MAPIATCRTGKRLVGSVSRYCWTSRVRSACRNQQSTIATTTRIQHNELSSETEPTIYNSLTSKIEPISLASAPSDKGLAWYTCGPTVYAPAHLGHARTYVCLDILRRVLEFQSARSRNSSRAPLFVLNITDVDDKILAAANDSNKSPLELARHYEAEFWKDWDDLNCLRPHVVTRVTEHVESSIIPYIQHIWDKKMAYLVDGDGVYFDVKEFERASETIHSKYGKLAPPAQATDLFDSHPTSSVSAADMKHDARDFCLWKLRKENEQMYWPSPWGEGRPGWHIECSAMIEAVQNQFRDQYTFMVHAGGIDLKFPHHTNEIAQAEAYHISPEKHQNKKEWIPQWLHTGHLHIDGMKMSKSLKNFVTIQELLSTNDPEKGGAWSSPADDFRLWCLGLSGSYRGPATYSEHNIAQARQMRYEKFCKFLSEGHDWLFEKQSRENDKLWQTEDLQFFRVAQETRVNCINALNSDLDGTSFVKELVVLSEKGLTYIRQAQKDRLESPCEPVLFALQTLRDLLGFVGFSNVTCRAGLDSSKNDNNTSQVSGGERALLDELVLFRQNIRNAALSMSNDDPASLKKEILRLCDQAREVTFPALGVELNDSKVHSDREIGNASSVSWSYCVPRIADSEKKSKKVTNRQSMKRLEEIPLHEFFRSEQYKGMFSAYTDDGFPTHNADGSELSKSIHKKLSKKRQAHERRLGQHNQGT